MDQLSSDDLVILIFVAAAIIVALGVAIWVYPFVERQYLDWRFNRRDKLD